jgi:hypothetical protein
MHVGAVGWLAKRSNETGAPPRRIAVRPFVCTELPGRVVFGFGTLTELAGEIGRLKCSRAMLLCTPRQLPHTRSLADGLCPASSGLPFRRQVVGSTKALRGKFMTEATIKIGDQVLTADQAEIIRVAVDRWSYDENVDVGSKDHAKVREVKSIIEKALGKRTGP